MERCVGLGQRLQAFRTIRNFLAIGDWMKSSKPSKGYSMSRERRPSNHLYDPGGIWKGQKLLPVVDTPLSMRDEDRIRTCAPEGNR